MGRSLENISRTEWKTLEKQLKTLKFSAYESDVYIYLTYQKKPIEATDIATGCESFYEKKFPDTKVYAALRNLEQKDLVQKIEGYPVRFRLRTGTGPLKRYLARAVNTEIEGIRNKEKDLYKTVKDVVEKLSDQKLDKNGIWPIYSTEEAGKITADMCKRAKEDIRIMTEYGGWIHKNDEFRDTLEKKNEERVKIWALLADMDYVEASRKQERKDFENFLKKIGTKYFCYQPKSLRMTVVDRKESLFIMFKDPKDEQDPISYYTAQPEISESLAEYFSMKCLSEQGTLLKSFVREKAPDLKDLFFC